MSFVRGEQVEEKRPRTDRMRGGNEMKQRQKDEMGQKLLSPAENIGLLHVLTAPV